MEDMTVLLRARPWQTCPCMVKRGLKFGITSGFNGFADIAHQFLVVMQVMNGV
jgi:hypothetical protein